MRPELLEILACPLCKGPLTLTITAAEGDEVLTGDFHCSVCDEHYPIADGIPNLLPPALRRAMEAQPGGGPGLHT